MALEGLFAPDSVAVIGATEREGSVGRAIVRNLLDDFVGEIMPVNPNRETVFGIDCIDSVTEADAELVVVVVPADDAVEVVRDAAEAGVRDVVVITAGFGEAGSEGVARERALAAVAAEYDINLVGPNSLGVISTQSGLNATFGPRMAEPGTVSFMSQSGAFVTAVLDWAADHDVGFKDVVSLGNKAVLDEGDFVRAWGDDPETDVVLGYLESIEDGTGFVRTAREVTRHTPIVVVKSGRTEAGAHAAASHTGAIAGSEAAYEAGLDKAGVIRANSVQELFDYGGVLAGQSPPETDGVAIVTNAGGPGVMATDAVGDSGLELASFSPETHERLDDALPDTANVYNPVDVVGDAGIDRFRSALEIVLSDPTVGSAVVLSSPTAVLTYEELADTIVDVHESTGVPVATALMGGESTRGPARTLAEAGIPNYFDPARAVGALDALGRYREIRTREYHEPHEFDVDRATARSILERAADRGRTRLGVEAMGLLDAYGIPTPTSEIVTAREDAVRAAHEIGDRVAMKLVSPDVLHKSDIGGVEVDVPAEAAGDVYEDLVTRIRSYQPDATLLGVQVQTMVDTDDGVETIVGATRDPQFGPLLLFGLGGIFVEVLEDTTVRVAPVSGSEAEGMVDDIDAAPLLRGARGRPSVDETAVVETIQRLSQLVTDFPAILELDVNPLVARSEGAVAIDIRLTIDPDTL